jgi:hypothetical protein
MKIKMEEKVKKYAICPCCDAEIKWIKQFPLAEITSFKYIQLPVLIRGPVEDVLTMQGTRRGFFGRKKISQNQQIPEEVMQMLANLNEYSYNGKVYERVTLVEGSREVREDFFKYNPNLTEEDFKRVFGERKTELGVRIYTDLTSDVNRFLAEKSEALKTLEGYVRKTVQTKDIFDLFQINNKQYTDVREFSFYISEENLGECSLYIDSERSGADMHLGLGPDAYMLGFSLEVAKFEYKGLFRGDKPKEDSR